MKQTLRGALVAGLTCLIAGTASPGMSAQKSAKVDDPRPKLVLKARPNVGFAPAKIMLTAELSGGANDFEEYYCPTVLWEWDDGTESESTFDCEPYEAGKSEIRRRITVNHTFRVGVHKVWVRLKRNDKLLASAYVIVTIQPGAGIDGDER
jgi:hypothetical protein